MVLVRGIKDEKSGRKTPGPRKFIIHKESETTFFIEDYTEGGRNGIYHPKVKGVVKNTHKPLREKERYT